MTGTPPARASVTAVVGVLGAVGLMLLLVTWAATIGPQQVLADNGNPPSYASITPTQTATAAPSSGSQRSEGDGNRDILLAVVTVVATMLAAIVMIAMVLTVVRWLLTRSWARRRADPEPDEVAFDPLEAPPLLAEAFTRQAPDQRALLATGSPRNAIVACWHRFEEESEAAGSRRQPWETSSEFTLRVLDDLSADSAAATALAELYREARHSAHEPTEADRAAAVEALDAIHRSLGSRALGGRAGTP